MSMIELRSDALRRCRGTGWGILLLLLLVWFRASPCAPASPPPPFRPAPAKGGAASTVLVYSEAFAPYTLVNFLEAVALQLRRVDISLETVPFDGLAEERLRRADYVVVFCPRKPVVLPPVLLKALMETNRPVLWIGWGAEQLAGLDPIAGQFRVLSDEPPVRAARVQYRGQLWAIPPSLWLPVELPAGSSAVAVMSLADTNSAARPGCWRSGHVTCFGTLPGEGLLSYLFSDMLLDFFGVSETAPSRVLLRIDDYHPLGNHHAFLRMVDFLYARSIPFVVAVTPASREPGTDRIVDLDSRPDFVQALLYAQRRGGRMILRGALRQPDQTGEFWNTDLDRPQGGDMAAYTRGCLEKACRQLTRHGLLPLAWETPHYAASSAVVAEVARFFSTAVERVQLSDATRQAVWACSSLTRDQWGRLIVPENLGYVAGPGPDPFPHLVREARLLLDMRGTVAGCSFHAYLPLDRLMALVARLESGQASFLDLLDLDHWVRWPGGLLLTGRAQVQTRLHDGQVRWRAFDRAGQLTGETTARTLFSGDRLFERRGLGAVELFEEKEDRP